MAHMLVDWKGKCGGIYLFANGKILDFYSSFWLWPGVGVPKYRIHPASGEECAPWWIISEFSQSKALLYHYQECNPYSLLQWEYNYLSKELGRPEEDGPVLYVLERKW